MSVHVPSKIIAKSSSVYSDSYSWILWSSHHVPHHQLWSSHTTIPSECVVMVLYPLETVCDLSGLQTQLSRWIHKDAVDSFYPCLSSIWHKAHSIRLGAVFGLTENLHGRLWSSCISDLPARLKLLFFLFFFPPLAHT